MKYQSPRLRHGLRQEYRTELFGTLYQYPAPAAAAIAIARLNEVRP
jgi:hypothetical protein